MFQEQIEAGAKLLDERKPDWIHKINLEELDLQDSCFCVVGQSFPDRNYLEALCDLFPAKSVLTLDQDQYAHGFAVKYSSAFGMSTSEVKEKYIQLTEEWKAYIQERRAQHHG